MMQKFVDLRAMGTKLQLVSAFAVDHIKGFVFIEADKLCDVQEVIYVYNFVQVACSSVVLVIVVLFLFLFFKANSISNN